MILHPGDPCCIQGIYIHKCIALGNGRICIGVDLKGFHLIQRHIKYPEHFIHRQKYTFRPACILLLQTFPIFQNKIPESLILRRRHCLCRTGNIGEFIIFIPEHSFLQSSLCYRLCSFFTFIHFFCQKPGQHPCQYCKNADKLGS